MNSWIGVLGRNCNSETSEPCWQHEQVFFIIALTQSTSHTKQNFVSDSILKRLQQSLDVQHSLHDIIPAAHQAMYEDGVWHLRLKPCYHGLVLHLFHSLSNFVLNNFSTGNLASTLAPRYSLLSSVMLMPVFWNSLTAAWWCSGLSTSHVLEGLGWYPYRGPAVLSLCHHEWCDHSPPSAAASSAYQDWETSPWSWQIRGSVAYIAMARGSPLETRCTPLHCRAWRCPSMCW